MTVFIHMLLLLQNKKLCQNEAQPRGDALQQVNYQSKVNPPFFSPSVHPKKRPKFAASRFTFFCENTDPWNASSTVCQNEVTPMLTVLLLLPEKNTRNTKPTHSEVGRSAHNLTQQARKQLATSAAAALREELHIGPAQQEPLHVPALGVFKRRIPGTGGGA